MLTALWLLTPLFLVGTFLILWFDFSLPVFLTQKIKRLGLWRRLAWPENLGEMTQAAWRSWSWTVFSPETAYWLNCPGCIATRMCVLLSPFWAVSFYLSDQSLINSFLLGVWTVAVGVPASLFLLWGHRICLKTAQSPQNPPVSSENPVKNPNLPPPNAQLVRHRPNPPQLHLHTPEIPVDTWRQGLLARGSVFDTSERVSKLGDADAAALQWMVFIESGQPSESCAGDRDFPGCSEMVEQFQQDFYNQPLGCTDCDRARIQRSWWHKLGDIYARKSSEGQ